MTSSTFDRNKLIADAEMLDADAMTAAQVDAFLKKPYPHIDDQPSCLAKQTFGGKTVGQLLVEKAQKHGISPLFLLAHLQKESSLVGAVGTCDAGLVQQAFGCGCPDGGACAPQYAGFANQTECAAQLTRSYLDDLAAGKTTISGWAVGKAKTTSDGQSIKPTTRAAAVLYTYTPWVGDTSYGGNPAPFGNYLFWKTYTQFASTIGYKGPGAPQCTTDAQCNGGKGGTGKVCGTTGANKGTCIAGCHGDGDCPGGQTCDQSGPAWTCKGTTTGGPLPLGAACRDDAACSGGQPGTERVCSASSHACIAACHADGDCPSGKTCDKTGATWVCKAPALPLGAACTDDAACSGGKAGSGRVCSTASQTCISGCHADTDCAGTDVCNHGATWTCGPKSAPTGGALDVPYECQNTNGTGLGGSTCQITSAAMVLRYWGAKGKGTGKNTYALDVLNTYGGYDFAKSPSGVAALFQDHGLHAKWTASGTVAEMKAHLDAGRPLVVNGFFTKGHVVVFVGYDATGFFLNDPNGDWNGTPYVSGSVSYAGTSCPGTSGKAVHVSFGLIESSNVICTQPGPCWEGASGVWYAVADGAPFLACGGGARPGLANGRAVAASTGEFAYSTIFRATPCRSRSRSCSGSGWLDPALGPAPAR